MSLQKAEAQRYATWFRCLADPTRLQILNTLAGARRPMSVGEIVNVVEVGQSTVSEHLRRLAESCFVTTYREATSTYFEINAECIGALPSAAEVVMGSDLEREHTGRGDARTTMSGSR